MELDVVYNLWNGHDLQTCEHIVRVFETIEVDPGLPLPIFFIVMELCEGTLHSFLEEGKGGVNIPGKDIFGILIHIADGLRYCHDRGYVHRDLNPRNGM